VNARVGMLLSFTLVVAVLATAAALAVEAAAAPRVGSEVAWGRSPVIVFTGLGGIYAVSPRGGTVHRVTRAGGVGISLSPNGRTLVFANDCTLYRIDVSGKGRRRLGHGCTAAWAPDGKRIAFLDDAVYVMNADGRHRQKLAANYSSFSPFVTWSPDSRKLAYVACNAPEGSESCDDTDNLDVNVVGADGSEQHKVTPKPSFPQCPAWSSVAKLAFLYGDVTATVKQGGGLRTLHPGGCPSWAPDGSRLAVPTGDGVALMNYDGSRFKRITILRDAHTQFSDSAWSADGTRLAVVGLNRLWVVGADGSGLRRLA
jgi:Tol biopolymer transport system component